jgi:hypothetical protein
MMPSNEIYDKLLYSAEMVGNLTDTHIELHLKTDDGPEKLWEVKRQAVIPKLLPPPWRGSLLNMISGTVSFPQSTTCPHKNIEILLNASC